MLRVVTGAVVEVIRVMDGAYFHVGVVLVEMRMGTQQVPHVESPGENRRVDEQVQDGLCQAVFVPDCHWFGVQRVRSAVGGGRGIRRRVLFELFLFDSQAFCSFPAFPAFPPAVARRPGVHRIGGVARVQGVH